jgi:hypothetical protein
MFTIGAVCKAVTYKAGVLARVKAYVPYKSRNKGK